MLKSHITTTLCYYIITYIEISDRYVIVNKKCSEYLIEKCLAIPTSPFFILLVNGYSVIREYVVLSM